MSIVKLNNRSVKDVTAFGSISSLGSLTHIATQTASSSASLSFTSGIDSTYKEYIFYFVNMHPSAQADFSFNMSIDAGSNYNIAKTSTVHLAYHHEGDSYEGAGYNTTHDLAQGTGFQNIAANTMPDADGSCSGYLHIFNPSSTTFVKHYIAVSHRMDDATSNHMFVGGYGNTTSAVDAIQFKNDTGTMDAGIIFLHGLTIWVVSYHKT